MASRRLSRSSSGSSPRIFRHPSLHTKKYDEAQEIWQARVTREWRFYFQIHADTYVILSVIPHPK